MKKNMLRTRFLAAFCVSFLSIGCAGVGVVATSDPLVKLNDAEYLFKRQNRPLPAERLIREAIVIYQEKDDPHGLGNAYREYGDLLTSPAVVEWQTVYRRDGFQDKSVTFENRAEKASEHYGKALDYYRDAEQRHREAAEFGKLTNVYVNMAWSYHRLGDRMNSCSYYDRALEAYAENMRRNPSAKPYAPSGTVPEFVQSAKVRAGCA